MRRNCNLNLCLLTPAPDSSQDTMEQGSSSSESSTPQQPQQLTVFYGGRICVYDVTELQARAIICLARQDNERMRSPNSVLGSPSSSLPSHHQIQSPTGISMKISLQRFLQKRKNRINDATHPYRRS